MVARRPRRHFWPATVPREESLAAFQTLFAALGYIVCANAEYKVGFDRIAIYATEGVPTHAARQLPSGRWTSKLGLREDIEHDLQDLEGDAYGRIALIMRRTRAT